MKAHRRTKGNMTQYLEKYWKSRLIILLSQDKMRQFPEMLLPWLGFLEEREIGRHEEQRSMVWPWAEQPE